MHLYCVTLEVLDSEKEFFDNIVKKSTVIDILGLVSSLPATVRNTRAYSVRVLDAEHIGYSKECVTYE